MMTLLSTLTLFATFAMTEASGSAEDGLRQLFDNFDSNNDGSLEQGDMERLAQTLSNPQNWRSMQNMQNREAIRSWGHLPLVNLNTRWLGENIELISEHNRVASIRISFLNYLWFLI